MPARVDHRLLLATLAAAQSARMVAVARRHVARPLDSRAALVALLNRDAGWHAAAAALGGSFAPRTATVIAGKVGATLMKARFTLPF